jgi:hypothetical protein
MPARATASARVRRASWWRGESPAISEFTGLPISRALMTVRNWELTDRENQIAGRVWVDEIRRA